MASLSTEGSIALAFFGGFIAALLAVMIGTFALLRMGDAYGLGHWKLNARMPLTTMWMNLGYWYSKQHLIKLLLSKFSHWT